MSRALGSRLHDRAGRMAAVRAFFAAREVVEVDVPALSPFAAIDAHIDLFETEMGGRRGFLHSSPEYGMKCLLADGFGDCFQLSHVFRRGERGERHRPEFTMAEWYRCGFSLKEMIDETLAFCRLFVECEQVVETTYDALFEKFGFDPTGEDRDAVFGFEIEPHLGEESFVVITDFPAEDAALSKVVGGKAQRFEVIHKGMELANGFDELDDPEEHRARFAAARKELPVDTEFLAALERGLPACCGVAVGFDRLMMLRHGVETIDEVVHGGVSL